MPVLPNGAGTGALPPSLSPLPSTAPRVVRRPSKTSEPGWLEHTRPSWDRGESAMGSWVDDELIPYERKEGLRFDTAQPVPLAPDPGLPDVPIRSPVTGRLVEARDILRDREFAVMPTLSERTDILELREAFADLVDKDELKAAVALPGPVMTGPNMQPRRLCKRVALGLAPTEVLLRDMDHPTAQPVRLAVQAIFRLEVLDGGEQLSLHLQDGRQIHLDLRGLRLRTLAVGRALVNAFEALLG